MRTKLMLLLLALAVFVPMQALAQFGDGGNMQGTPVWEQFELDKDKRITMNFRKASVDSVILLLARESGVTIVKDPKLTEKVTLITPKPVSLAEAFATLNAQLKLMNYELAKDEGVMVIRARQQRGGGMDEDAIRRMIEGAGQNRDNNVLKVYRIQYANASAVARVVNDVFLQQDQTNPFVQMFSRGRGGRGGRGGFSFRGQSSGSQTGATVRASSDDFSNTVIVNAPRDKQLEVEALIEEIDQQTDTPQTVKVYPLEFALAENVVPTIQSVMAANETTGRGGQSGNADFFSRISRLRSGVTAGGSVIADVRTNSLIITATDQNHETLAQVISELDHDVPYVATTFVFPLDNARADDVAELLNQAFQQQRGGNRGRTNRGTTNRGTQSNRNNRNQGNRGGGGGGRGVEGSNSLEYELEDPDLEYGELLTMVTYGGGGGFGQAQNQGGVGRGLGGQVINTLQAQGQVTIIADPNTNSLIVIGSPEIAEMVRNLLTQLDRIPEQVMIETIIVEATLDESTKLGVEWSLVSGSFLGSSATGLGETDFGIGNQNPPAQGFRYTVTGGNLGVFLNALQTDEKFKVLSTPRIFTSNNVEAEINISQSVPFIVSQRVDVNGNFIFNYSFQDVGIVLTVTPHISANGMVTLDIVQTANDLQGFTDFNAPIVNQRMARTTVSVMDGETIILGGIMRSQVRTIVKKVPILGDIPILGQFFRSTEKREEMTELIVFLTPRIVRSPEDAERLRRDSVDKLSDQSKADYNRVRPPKTGGDDKKTGNGNGN